MKKYQITCSSCNTKRYVSYVPYNDTKRGVYNHQCRDCYKSSSTPTTPLAVRLVRKLKQDKNGCLVWTGSLMPNGYARIGIGGRGTGGAYIHRVAYELKYGKIPKDLQIDHLCRNRACANVDHLEAVTARENTLRSIKVREENRRLRLVESLT